MNLLKQITESQHPDKLVDLTLREIVQSGRITNPYQTYVLGAVSQAIKNSGVMGQIYLEGPVTYSGGTSNEVVNAMKALTDSEAAGLAQYLLDCMSVGGTVLHNSSMTLSDWTKFVLNRQD